MAKATKWETIPHIGSKSLKVEVRTVKHKRRVFTEQPVPETREEVLSLIEAQAGELRKIEAASKKARAKATTTRKPSHWCTSGPVCQVCGIDYFTGKVAPKDLD
jgi:hypothetical protein